MTTWKKTEICGIPVVWGDHKYHSLNQQCKLCTAFFNKYFIWSHIWKCEDLNSRKLPFKCSFKTVSKKKKKKLSAVSAGDLSKRKVKLTFWNVFSKPVWQNPTNTS